MGSVEMKRKYQMVHEYRFDQSGLVQTERSSFKTLESAVNTAEMFIYRKESWIRTTVLSIEILDKESGEVVWEYKAEN